MKWLMRMLGLLSEPKPEVADVKFTAAMHLSDEVSAKIRERAHSINPFRDVLSEMLLGARPADPVLIGDAFEIQQEARIFKGPLNGKG